ncbi:MAG: TlpA family protein disulfide reductase [Gammaproteobacteria bacterium]|nr:MAG: TlpA family protein disulfide reductase [Gammaproteobacteria bacterium]
MNENKGVERLLQGIVVLLGVLILLDALILWHVTRVERSVAPLRAVAPQSAREGIQPGKKAPPFALKDMKGQTITLAQFAGKPFLLIFASTECGACRRMFPNLSAYHQKHPEQRIVMILAGSERAKEEVVNKYGFDFPILSWDDKVAHAYKVPGTPWFFLLDDKGVVVRSGTANTLEGIEAFVEKK